MTQPVDKVVLIEEITKVIPNRYEAVRVMAREARRLNSLIIRGAQVDADFKPTTAAIERTISEKVKFEYIDSTERVPEFEEKEE